MLFLPAAAGGPIDAHGNILKEGDHVRCLEKQGYFMQDPRSDYIGRNDVVTIESIDDGYGFDQKFHHERWGRLFFKEHADKYGPWEPKFFVLVMRQKGKWVPVWDRVSYQFSGIHRRKQDAKR